MAEVKLGKKGFLRKSEGWVCEFCKEKFLTRRKLYAHSKVCSVKQSLPKDSLGRIKNLEAYKKSTETIRRRIASGELKVEGHPHTEEMKKHLSEKRIAYMESHGNYGLKWYIVNRIKVQGTWEKKFAEYLVEKNIQFERRRLKFLGSHVYTPDFYCKKENVYFEVKGFRRDRDIYKMYLVLDEHPNIHIKMIEKEQLRNLDNIDIFKLPDFQELYHREDIDMTKFKNVWGTGATG